MNLHDRIETAVLGGMPDQAPFTIYRDMVPKGEAERLLRGKGLGFWWRQSVSQWEHPNCDIKTVHYTENGARLARTIWTTPVGETFEVHRLGGEYGAAWMMEWPVKRREDYRVMEFVARDAQAAPLYEEFESAARRLGGGGYAVSQFSYSPLMTIIVTLVGFETAAYHMADYPDEFWSLYEALETRNRRAYPVVAGGPQHVTLYGGNVHPEILGRERFEKYVVPCYDEFADYLHERGKLMAVHFDADNAHWADIIARSKIDIVEAFTPPPDCDLSVADARKAWPDKVLSLNFPSSVHLAEPEVIREATLEILRQADDGHGFILGITEDIPPDCWEKSLNAIADCLNEYGKLPLSLQ